VNGRKLNGVIIEVDPRLGQTVETDAAEEHLKIIHLHGWNRIKGNPPVARRSNWSIASAQATAYGGGQWLKKFSNRLSHRKEALQGAGRS